MPNKALRPIAGQSPLKRIVETALTLDARVVVTTNDPATRRAVGDRVDVWEQPAELCEPTVPLDGPVAWATTKAEAYFGQSFAIVVTLQVTCPFTRQLLVQRAIAMAQEHGTALTVRDDRGLRWRAEPNQAILRSRAPQRLVRQQMPATWRETGAVLATQRRYVTPTSRFGPVIYLIPTTGREAIDIDTPEDWALAEWYAGPTNREMLLARLLANRGFPRQMPIALFSAYREEPTEWHERQALAAALADASGGPLLEIEATHTYDECVQVLTASGDSSQLCLVTSAYHMPRVFLTMLAVLQHRPMRLWPNAAMSPMTKWALEIPKIERYQTLGHAVSIEAGLAALDAWEAVPTTAE